MGFLKIASFSERVLPVWGFLSLPFLTRFPHMRCRIQGQGFGNKMYISEFFTVVGYLYTGGFKNRWGINFAKCMFFARIAREPGYYFWTRMIDVMASVESLHFCWSAAQCTSCIPWYYIKLVNESSSKSFIPNGPTFNSCFVSYFCC